MKQLSLPMSNINWRLPKWFGAADSNPMFDRGLLFALLAILGLGFVMVSSASIGTGEQLQHDALYFMKRQAVFVLMGLVVFSVVVSIPMALVERLHLPALLAGFVLLIGVLVLGKEVNGSTRWIALGPLNLQGSEVAKLCFFVYLASYMRRKNHEVRENLKGFIKPLVAFFFYAGLILLQPDLGTVVVLFVTTLALLFIGGAKLWQFIALILTGLGAIVSLIILEPYRMARVISFTEPFKYSDTSGYQLVQSLLAFGRGDWLGQGLGNSVQKLLYLPESHTDFIFSVLAEELGFIGVVGTLMLFFFMVWRAFSIASTAAKVEHFYGAFLAYAIATWMCFQTVVNVGVCSGALPTKGLTLPFISYGGSSLMVMMAAVALLFRIDFEARMTRLQAVRRRGS